MELSDKIDFIIKEQALSPLEFAEKVGIGESSAYKMLRGDIAKMQMKTAKKINKAFPKYTIDWLMFDNEMTINDSLLNDEKAVYDRKKTTDLDKIVDVILENEPLLMQHKVFKLWLETKIQAQIIDRFNEI